MIWRLLIIERYWKGCFPARSSPTESFLSTCTAAMVSSASLRPSPAVSRACFVLGALAFLGGWVLLFLAAPDVVGFFYEARVLAVVHTFTLGWITLVMFGVLYQYVPALTKHPVTWPRAAGAQIGVYTAGVIGMIAHFWMGSLSGMAWSAWLVATGVFFFAAQVLPALLRALRFNASLIGLIAAIVYLIATAAIGLVLAIDKVVPLVGGNPLSNLAAHAHLAMLGWISLTICAVSYRVVAAFLLPATRLPCGAPYQVGLLIGAIPALSLALFMRSPLTPVAGAVVAIGLGWYIIIIGKIVRSRRMPLDWSLMHVLAALVHLAVAILAALALLFVEPESEIGSRLVVAYGTLLLVGWISNYIVGVGSRMIPGLMGRGSGPLLSPAGQAVLFSLLNGGIVGVIASALVGSVSGVRVASTLPIAAAALMGGAVLARAVPLGAGRQSEGERL